MTNLVRIVALGGALVAASATITFAGPFGPLSLERLDGRPASLAALQGRVVLLNFWATWCKPCVAEMPILADLATRHEEDGLLVVAATVDEADARAAVESMARELPAAVQVWVGATLDDMERLGVGSALPVTVLLDREGDVARLHPGPLEPGGLDDEIAELLQRAPAPEADPGLDFAKDDESAAAQPSPATVAAPTPASPRAENGETVRTARESKAAPGIPAPHRETDEEEGEGAEVADARPAATASRVPS